MRTSIYFERGTDGEWLVGDDDPHVDVTHDEPLTDEQIEAWRSFAKFIADGHLPEAFATEEEKP